MFYGGGLVVGKASLEASDCLSKYGKGVRRERLSCYEMAENTTSGLQCEMAMNWSGSSGDSGHACECYHVCS